MSCILQKDYCLLTSRTTVGSDNFFNFINFMNFINSPNLQKNSYV